MVINLARHRAAIICGIVIIVIACLVVGKTTPEKKLPEKTAAPNKATQYGQFIKWEDARVLFPKYAKATITDFETGKGFRVQRRGGSSHADVQPLTAKDTGTMKEIYQGKWSWRRRSVTVTLDDGTMIAASMAGMPHGQGAIRGNRFNGHFCLHFRDSKTHGSGNVDLAHQMMIWKAANVLDYKLTAMSANEAATAFITAIDQGDQTIACRMIVPEEISCLARDMKAIKSTRINRIKQVSTQCFEVSLFVQYDGQSREIPKQGRIILVPTGRGWLVHYPSARTWLLP